MNKRNLLLVCIMMILSIAFYGCGGDVDKAKSDSGATISCSITVDDFCSDKVIALEECSSVFDALKESGADISARKSTHGLYVEGINGRFEFDEGPTSGWVYTVNDERATISCDEYKLKADDVIVWEYVTSYEE